MPTDLLETGRVGRLELTNVETLGERLALPNDVLGVPERMEGIDERDEACALTQ